MLKNAPNCTIKIFFSAKHASEPPSKPPPSKKNSCPHLANLAYAHELLPRNLFENPP